MKLTLIDNLGRLVTQPASFPAAGAPTDSTYLTLTPNAGLSAEYALSLLGAGLLYNIPGTGLQIADYSMKALPYVNLKDRKANNVAGGGSTVSTYVRRDLNSEDADTKSICTLSGNQFTLLAGTYVIRASAPAYAVASHKIRLYNATNAAVQNNIATQACIGLVERSPAAALVQTRAWLIDVFTLTATNALEIQHNTAITVATNGFGIAANFGDAEIYTCVELMQVA